MVGCRLAAGAIGATLQWSRRTLQPQHATAVTGARKFVFTSLIVRELYRVCISSWCIARRVASASYSCVLMPDLAGCGRSSLALAREISSNTFMNYGVRTRLVSRTRRIAEQTRVRSGEHDLILIARSVLCVVKVKRVEFDVLCFPMASRNRCLCGVRSHHRRSLKHFVRTSPLRTWVSL